MKYFIIALLFCICCVGYNGNAQKPLTDSGMILNDIEWNCLVAHVTEDGVFTCDYHGHYYPEKIYNDSIRKWFIKIVGNDSLFYYRHPDDTSNYIWNGNKNDECGYDFKYNGEVVSSLCLKYNGSDTIQRINQVWSPSPPNPKPFPIPDTTKPLNIKMKPRWMDSVIKEEIIILPLVERIIDSGYLSKSPFDTFLPKIDLIISLGMDTVKVIMLCSDTSSQNGYRTQRCYWMYGWEVRYYIDSVGFPNDYDVQEYIDENKKPLSKYLVVWISKQVK